MAKDIDQLLLKISELEEELDTYSQVNKLLSDFIEQEGVYTKFVDFAFLYHYQQKIKVH